MSDGSEIRGALPAGTVLQDRYTIERTLGRGGFAITYLCRSGMYEKPSAIKEFLPSSLAHRETDSTVHPITPDDAEFFERGLADFIEEGRRLVQCRHPNVVQVEDHFEQYGTAYLVMEFVEGGTLYDYLLDKGSLDAPSLIQMTNPLLDALDTVHAQGLLHRDLTPNNIILRDGDVAKPVLIDFGAARHSNGIRSATIAQIVNDGYSPPEQYQAREEQTPALDIYAVGCTLYRCLTGERPPRSIDRYSRDPVATLAERFKGGAARLFVPILMKALDLDPTMRHQSAAELKAEIATIDGVLAVLSGLDGEAGAADQPDGLFWSIKPDGSIELTGMLQSLAQFEQLQSQLASASPGLQLVNRAELKTTPAPKETPSIPRSEAATVLVGQSTSAAEQPDKASSTASNEPGDGSPTDTNETRHPQEATTPRKPQRRFSGLAKTAAVFIGAATLAGGIYLFIEQSPEHASRPSTQPAQPAPSTQAARPTPSTQPAQPTPSTQAARPIPSTQPAQPAPSTQAARPTPSTQPAPPIPAARPAPAEPKRQAENRFGVTIEVPRDTYQVGDAITFSVTATKDCNFSVHTVDANGAHVAHDPSKLEVFMGPRRLRAGETRSIPIEGAPGKAIVQEPRGVYQLFAVCGRKDLEQLGVLNERLGKALSNAKRNFKFVFEEELKSINRELLARASVAYTVE